MSAKKRLFFVSGSPLTSSYFFSYIANGLNSDFNIYHIGSGALSKIHPLHNFRIDLPRNISFFSDLKLIFRLGLIFMKYRPDIIVTMGPKAGLFGCLVGAIMGVNVRTHCFTGQVWAAGKREGSRLAKVCDWIICRTSNFPLIDSLAQKEFLISSLSKSFQKLTVIHRGSVIGANISEVQDCLVENVRSAWGIKREDMVLGYCGRVCAEKGIFDLLKAYFEKLESPKPILVIVGDIETDDFGVTLAKYRESYEGSVVVVGKVEDPRPYLKMFDVLALPSYREGFGQVVIEAGAVGTPAIVSDIYGLRDTVLDKQTGIKFEVGNTDQLAGAIKIFFGSNVPKSKTLLMGNNARRYVINNFDREVVIDFWKKFLVGIQ